MAAPFACLPKIVTCARVAAQISKNRHDLFDLHKTVFVRQAVIHQNGPDVPQGLVAGRFEEFFEIRRRGDAYSDALFGYGLHENRRYKFPVMHILPDCGISASLMILAV